MPNYWKRFHLYGSRLLPMDLSDFISSLPPTLNSIFQDLDFYIDFYFLYRIAQCSPAYQINNSSATFRIGIIEFYSPSGLPNIWLCNKNLLAWCGIWESRWSWIPNGFEQQRCNTTMAIRKNIHMWGIYFRFHKLFYCTSIHATCIVLRFYFSSKSLPRLRHFYAIFVGVAVVNTRGY